MTARGCRRSESDWPPALPDEPTELGAAGPPASAAAAGRPADERVTPAPFMGGEIMAEHILVALRRRDRVEQIIPFMDKIAGPGVRVDL